MCPEPEASSRPSGLNATDKTKSVWPERVRTGWPWLSPPCPEFPAATSRTLARCLMPDEPYGEHTNLPSLARGAGQTEAQVEKHFPGPSALPLSSSGPWQRS
jgi:hypothetical protein